MWRMNFLPASHGSKVRSVWRGGVSGTGEAAVPTFRVGTLDERQVHESSQDDATLGTAARTTTQTTNVSAQTRVRAATTGAVSHALDHHIEVLATHDAVQCILQASQKQKLVRIDKPEARSPFWHQRRTVSRHARTIHLCRSFVTAGPAAPASGGSGTF